MSALFQPLTLRGVTFKNRIAVSPMSQYRADKGCANNWHMVHLGRFAMGGAGLVFAEATAVEEDGRRTYGDLGLWEDGQIAELARIAKFIETEGAVPGIQLGHAGRKASERRPWHGDAPLSDEDIKARDEQPWQTIAPSAMSYAVGWPTPAEMTDADIKRVIASFGLAAKRAHKAGFKVIEVYAAHGFLVHQFLSPIANKRTDRWGGGAEGRMRFAVEVAKAIRQHWPDDFPLLFRLSATDWVDGGLEIDDTIEIARALAAAGVDMIDCSTGGIGGTERPQRMKIEDGFQVPFSVSVKSGAGVPTMAVGFLRDAAMCEQVIASGKADMVALARELLANPNWPLHAAAKLGVDTDHGMWPPEAGWWLEKRAQLMRKLGLK
ncbi:NADH:flavin oxidoreductase/NADH oxidase [Kordiimonas aquimaris]|uniref:NADH:flavin oxidoreductase/NADH oxidase n=1 Tax=Kordiimonas aquimaris TaxID=707591 RepID=UPI0021CE26FC|nr:NADH:flavin oxidoreductase/NADH oxidase [Kordiimonas aquimaris]